MAKTFAQIKNDAVYALIEEVENIEDEWHPDVVATLVDVTDITPKPEVGWVYKDGEFSPPPPYVPETPAEEMRMALMAGCDVRSTSKPGLNAKYIANGPTWNKMTNEVIYIVSFNKFSGGLSSVEWPTKGDPVTFTDKNDFKNVVQAIGDWLTGWERYVAGNSPAAPTDFVTIS